MSSSFYYSFEDLYDANASCPQGEAGELAIELLKYYGFKPMLAFTIATDAPRAASPIILHVGNEENTIFQVLMQKIEDYDDYDAAVEETIKEITLFSPAITPHPKPLVSMQEW